MKNLRETTRKIIYALLTVVMVVSLEIAGAIVAIDLVDLWRAGSVSNDVRELYRPGASDGWLAALIGAASAEEAAPETAGEYELTVRARTEDGTVSPLASSMRFAVTEG